jgi:hypothetical protein
MIVHCMMQRAGVDVPDSSSLLFGARKCILCVFAFLMNVVVAY